MRAERYWQAALGQLQLEMPRAAYETWLRDTEFLTYEDGVFVIGVRNAYARDWLEDRLLSTVKRSLAGIMGRTVDVRFVIWQADSDPQEEPVLDRSPPMTEVTVASTCRMNSRYTFDNFVVGPSNRLAHAASLAVAERPSRSYNPLFLYGGVGLGKTHLLHAIGNVCNSADLRVLYVSSEEFTNDLVNAIRGQTTEEFRDRYRQIDVLLIDDIQFIAGKEATQEEFFHTFNTLHRQENQIVITSDRPPSALLTLEERLRSRFEWGLTVDIQVPDYETRLAILRAYAERSGKQVGSEYLELIAQRVKNNVRELEGTLNRVMAYEDLSGEPLSLQRVQAILAELMPGKRELTQDEIIAAVSTQYGVNRERLLGRDRSHDVALPRQVAMYLIREETDASLPEIGDTLGGRDHTTVMYGCGKISDLMETDEELRRKVLGIRAALYDQVSIRA
jgi:chromosomal replication initiator protein